MDPCIHELDGMHHACMNNSKLLLDVHIHTERQIIINKTNNYMYSILGQLATDSLINFEMVKAYIRLCDYSTSNAIRKKKSANFLHPAVVVVVRVGV